jgi:predicted patatin/cPLA2 family phospholipase
MSDGGIADGIPVIEAIRRGAINIMVVRSRHNHYMKKDTIIHKYIRWKLKGHPELVAVMKKRIEIYQKALSVISNPPKHVNIIEICPPTNFKMGRFNTQYSKLIDGYRKGKNLSKSTIERWNEMTS